MQFKISDYQAQPFDMNDDCSNNPDEYLNYLKTRCSDRRTNWLVFILLAFYCLLTNCMISDSFRLVWAANFLFKGDTNTAIEIKPTGGEIFLYADNSYKIKLKYMFQSRYFVFIILSENSFLPENSTPSRKFINCEAYF